MKIAITSQNFKTVTNHAGKTRRFMIFDVQDGQEPIEMERIDLPKEMAFSQFLGDEGHPIDGVDALLSASFGMGFACRMKKRGITASLTEKQDPIEAIKEFLACGPALPQEKASDDAKAHKSCHCSCGD